MGIRRDEANIGDLSWLFDFSFLLGNQVLDELGSFRSVVLDPFAQKHLADLCYGALFFVGDTLNISP